MNPPDALPNEFLVCVRMESDWHVGTGAGIPGGVDRLVRRDQDGLPFVPGKTLHSIWRDGCETVALGLDGGVAGGVWCKWVKFLFGTEPAREDSNDVAAPAALAVRAARLPSQLRAALAADALGNAAHAALREAVTFVKPGVRIDARSGRAMDKHLRFIEMARAGAVLESTCELTMPKDEDLLRTATALLVAGAAYADRLGGDRRRGAGRCQITVGGHDLAPWLKWLAEAQSVPGPPEAPARDLDESVSEELASRTTGASGGWVSLALRVLALAPIVIHERTVGNLVRTVDHVPGTNLLPLITTALSGLGGDVRAAIRRGDLIVTDATLELTSDNASVRGYPVPAALMHEKGLGGLKDGKGVVNRFGESLPAGGDRPLKPHKSGFVGPTVAGVLPVFGETERQTETHNTINDDMQRPAEGGGVYAYEAIRPGTSLRAEIRLLKTIADELAASDSAWWRRLAREKERIGRSSKDDYGLVRVEVLSNPQLLTDEPPAFDGREITAWLLSGVLLRDERLRPDSSIEGLRRALEGEFTVGLRVRASSVGHLSRAMWVRRRESWQARWGLPRPTLVGLGPGTAVVFEIAGDLDEEARGRLAQRLSDLEARGIGERRAEGFGQIRFNDPLLTEPTSSWTRRSHPGRSGAAAGGGGRVFPPGIPRADSSDPEGVAIFQAARIIEQAAWRAEIRRAALKRASNAQWRRENLGWTYDGAGRSEPPASQLGALRSAVRRLLKPGDRGQVLGWLGHLAGTANRAKEWPGDSLGKLRSLVDSDNVVWDLLEMPPLGLTENAEEDLRQALWGEAVRGLVYACMRAHRLEEERRAGSSRGRGD